VYFCQDNENDILRKMRLEFEEDSSTANLRFGSIKTQNTNIHFGLDSQILRDIFVAFVLWQRAKQQR